jgi:hypothetical protein
VDGTRFDGMARSLAGGASRRRVLGGLAALAAGLAGGMADGRTGRAQPDCAWERVRAADGRDRGRTAGRQAGPDAGSCPRGQERCGGACLDPAGYRRDPANCGACGAACPPPPNACLVAICTEAGCGFARAVDACGPVVGCAPGCGCATTTAGAVVCADGAGLCGEIACAADADCGPGGACLDLSAACGTPTTACAAICA